MEHQNIFQGQPKKYFIISSVTAVLWPSRSPDLNPMAFYFWGHMKSLIYETPVESEEDPVGRIVVAAGEVDNPTIFGRLK